MDEAKIILKSLFAAYPNSSVSPETVIVYVEDLQDISIAELRAVVKQARASCKFLPTIAELRDIHRLLTRDLAQPTPEEEWEKVTSEIRRIGSWGAPEFENAITKRTVTMMGWLNLCQSDTPGVDRAQFVKLYRGLIERGEKASRLIPAARQLAEQSAGVKPIGDIVRAYLTAAQNGERDDR